jgi:uncharacterized tellurite resistance protein B-like protein
MLKSFKRMLCAPQAEMPANERHHLQLAVAVLLHEARRADYAEGGKESAVGEEALADLFALERPAGRALLAQGRERAGQLTSFHAPVTAINRAFPVDERIRVVEHLWRVAFADGDLSYYEDHYVRKIAHLLYVPNTQSMLARNRARGVS